MSSNSITCKRGPWLIVLYIDASSLARSLGPEFTPEFTRKLHFGRRWESRQTIFDLGRHRLGVRTMQRTECTLRFAHEIWCDLANGFTWEMHSSLYIYFKDPSYRFCHVYFDISARIQRIRVDTHVEEKWRSRTLILLSHRQTQLAVLFNTNLLMTLFNLWNLQEARVKVKFVIRS